MNSPEFMFGTDRVVIKAMDDSKAIIIRDYLDDGNLSYLVSFTGTHEKFLSKEVNNLDYVIFVHKLIIDGSTATITGTLVENMALKEEYHVEGDMFIKSTVSYVPYPEESTSMIPITFCIDKIKEMTGDLEMLQDMMDESRLDALVEDLIKYDIIIKPQLTLLSKKTENVEVEDCFDDNVPLLTLINGRDKVKQKRHKR